MTNEYQQAREAIAKKLCGLIAGKTTPSNWQSYVDDADQILKLPNIAVLAKDQSLPEPRYQCELSICSYGCHKVEQNNMVTNGFKRVIEEK